MKKISHPMKHVYLNSSYWFSVKSYRLKNIKKELEKIKGPLTWQQFYFEFLKNKEYFLVDFWAQELLNYLPEYNKIGSHDYQVIPISPESIDLKDGVILYDFYQKVFEMGFVLCPKFLVLFFNLGLNRILYERITLASEFINQNSEIFSFVKEKRKGREQILVTGDFGNLNDKLNSGRVFLFLKPDEFQKQKFNSSFVRKKYFPDVGNKIFLL